MIENTKQRINEIQALEETWKGHDLLFTFREEAIKFATRNKLTIEYSDGEMIDEEHFKVKGHQSKLYWIC